MPQWKVEFRDSVGGDLDWFGKAAARALVLEIIERLGSNPLAETRNLKTLRPNPVAERELRLMGRYRVLFSVDRVAASVVVALVGEKVGDSLVVRGERFSAHESRTSE